MHGKVIYHADTYTLYSAPAPPIDIAPNDDSNSRARMAAASRDGSASSGAAGSGTGSGGGAASSSSTAAVGGGGTGGVSSSSSAGGSAGATSGGHPIDCIRRARSSYAGIHEAVIKYMRQFALAVLKQDTDSFFSVPLHKAVLWSLSSLLKEGCGDGRAESIDFVSSSGGAVPVDDVVDVKAESWKVVGARKLIADSIFFRVNKVSPNAGVRTHTRGEAGMTHNDVVMSLHQAL